MTTTIKQVDDEPIAKLSIAIFDADEENERVVFRYDGEPRTLVRQVMRILNERTELRREFNALTMEDTVNDFNLN
jgi:hypothetical protein